jgi:hypothetical protein
MTWKHCAILLDEDYACIRDAVGLMALAAGDPPEVGLFSRTTPDRRQRVLLLSPLAVELAGDALPARWTDCDAPGEFRWDMVFGRDDTCERLGLTRPDFRTSKAQSPSADPADGDQPIAC